MKISNEEIQKLLKDYSDSSLIDGDDNDNCEACRPERPMGMFGWICPKCGAVMSPYQSYCVKCSGNWEITFNGGIDIAHSSARQYTPAYITECNGGNLNDG